MLYSYGMDSETNLWDAVLGPFYTDTYLDRYGVDMQDLIDLHTADGGVVYPHAQFDVLNDGDLRRREPVLQLWNQLIRPAINEGFVDEWTATGLLLQETPDHPSRADEITADPSRIFDVTTSIQHAISRLRQ